MRNLLSRKARGIFFIVLLAFFSCNNAGSKDQQAISITHTDTLARNIGDTALVELVQKQTFKYFWDFAHPVSGMARERSNKEAYANGLDVTTIGGTGFGVMATIVATERKWIGRDTAAQRLLKLVNFLSHADSYHGVFSHWLNGATGKTIPFSKKDDGADLVETSYLFEGLLSARQYFNNDNGVETDLRNRINGLWNAIEWNWFTKGGETVLYWHWSPANGWAMNFPIRGFNECLIVYILAASAEKYPVKPAVYHHGWTESKFFINGKTYYGHKLPLGFEYGGPLFFSHYSFLGLDPHGLKDKYADYWEQNKNHTLINHDYCVDNPKEFKGYGENCWGLTAGDTYDDGYDAYSPSNDGGTIAPTAALSAFPYTPGYSMKALKHFYNDLGNKIWSEYGFVDGFNETKNWYAKSHLAIDQGPIIVMIENYRTGLLWKLFMSCPEIQGGLKKLGFESPYIKKQLPIPVKIN
ncbi:MAG: glucoamylase family protein [Ferruginibacter sp.]